MLDRLYAHVQSGSHLLLRQETLTAEPGEAVIDAVSLPKFEQNQTTEMRSLPGTQAALVQDRDHLGVGVVVEELVNLSQHVWVSLAKLPSLERER